MRVYLPTTLAGLAALTSASAGPSPAVSISPSAPVPDVGSEVAAAGTLAYAVTPALREWYREADLEELEYVALQRAAVASLHLLVPLELSPGAGRPPASAVGTSGERRVVLAADVPDAAARPDPESDVAAVRLGVGVTLRDVVSAHVDSPEAVPYVRTAIDRIRASGADDDDARFAVDELDDHELQWYAVQELSDLLG